ncbi:MAG: class I SAM-dependent methyltransferase [Actinobacteria bacterium]|jgi:SAM-dependent methyltransferase|nr:class I SAM-dependent methyltransferase [Actinomycetota bacterium]
MSKASYSHPIFARLFSWFVPFAEHLGISEHRDELLAGLTGRVVEIGAGSGANFFHYPDSVIEVVAVEPEPYLRTRALQAARLSSVPVQVVAGMAESLPVRSGAFDAAVVSLVLCSVNDQIAALSELFRVLRFGGELRFYEHVLAEEPSLACWQRRVDLIWPHLAGGCHTSRDTLHTIEQAGFLIITHRRFAFLPCILSAPVSPHVIGRAIKQLDATPEAVDGT